MTWRHAMAGAVDQGICAIALEIQVYDMASCNGWRSRSGDMCYCFRNIHSIKWLGECIGRISIAVKLSLSLMKTFAI